jgi:hypothetical protein
MARPGVMIPLTVRAAEYFYVRVESAPYAAYEILAALATEEIDILAFSAIPFGEGRVELTLFPASTSSLLEAAGKLGLSLAGPQHAILIHGDDHLGALAEIHRKLLAAGVRVYASSGVTDGAGRYGYVIYLKEGDYVVAARALGA